MFWITLAQIKTVSLFSEDQTPFIWQSNTWINNWILLQIYWSMFNYHSVLFVLFRVSPSQCLVFLLEFHKALERRRRRRNQCARAGRIVSHSTPYHIFFVLNQSCTLESTWLFGRIYVTIIIIACLVFR